MEYKITSFIIAIVVGSLFMATFGNMFFETGASVDNQLPTETNETIENLTKIDKIHETTKEIEQRHTGGNESVDRGAYDIIGTVFADTLGGLQMLTSSIGAFFGMSNVAIQTFKLDINFKLTLYAVIIVAIIIGVFIRVKLKQRI